MLTVRKASERGHFNHGWLDTFHTFSFASYNDPAHVRFRQLRVINEDQVQPSQGFATHPHENMEVISYVIDGALEHKDSMGNVSVIHRGEVQCMTAGTGITHSEYNHSDSELVHFLQIWIFPETKGLTPSYEQRRYADRLRPNTLCLIASHDGREDSVTIHQDVNLYTCTLEEGISLEYPIPSDRHVWLQVIKGNLVTNGAVLSTGDGCAISDESILTLIADKQTDFLLFDMG